MIDVRADIRPGGTGAKKARAPRRARSSRGTSEQGGAVLPSGTQTKKAAEANLIARREGTAAMPSQADNAPLMRLRVEEDNDRHGAARGA